MPGAVRILIKRFDLFGLVGRIAAPFGFAMTRVSRRGGFSNPPAINIILT